MQQPEKVSKLRQIIDFICCKGKPKYPIPYEFEINTEQLPTRNKEQFESNFIQTSKYSLISFLPKALLLQFYRLANCYFLLIAILLSIDIISPLSPLTAWAPLIIVIGLSIMRQGYEDFQRYKSDKHLNHKSFTRVFRDGQQKNQMQWSDVVVGDICHVKNQETFPADLILLSSALPTGAAYIQTASLDGEKNLKPRNSFKQTMALKAEDIKHIKGKFEGTIPDRQLHKFSARMTINNKTLSIEGDKQLLYRGTKLKNTEFIYGLVIYTGKNTKIMKNSEQQSAIKMSQVQRKVNYILGIVLCIQIVFCIVTAICYGVFRNQTKDSYYYIDWTDYSTPVDSIIIFFTYFVLINTMIPISLIVSIQMVKLFQKYFIDNDKFMYSEWRKLGVNVKSSSLNQQLGQIEYVFSDKTGTLTKNLMEFKIATIGQQMFGDLALIAPKGSMEKPSDEYGFHDNHLKDLLLKGTGDKPLNKPVGIKNGQGQQKITLKTLRQIGNQYFIALSIAHEVVAEHKQGKVVYQGPSPDEISLVQAAKQMNYEFISSTQSSATAKIQGKEENFQVLALFPFTSDRKRMSIIVRDKQEGNLIKMYTKGADNIIKQRLAKDNQLNLDDQLNRFSVIGLRTLLVGMRVISQKQYNAFRQAVEHLPPTNRQKPLEELQSKIEKQLYIIGATAVLDRLQDEVPETIRDLLRANIKVWMLTGDKMETAQNIAKSCNLIQPNFNILRYKPPSVTAKKDQTAVKAASITATKNKTTTTRVRNEADVQTAQNLYNVDHTLEGYIRNLVREAQQLTAAGLPKALLIEGCDLNSIIATEENQKSLARLAENCQAVVCCRLLPSQKKSIVKIVRKHLNKITLSIGDGANDIAMIKQAHIGVGLYGQEGMGAVQSADYALPEFRMLWRLLLVHGRWNYIRISEMILYFFYKNMLFTIPQFITAFFCGYSGQTLFDDVYIALYNLIFTAMPLVVRAVLEQDVNYVFKKKAVYLATKPFPQITGKSMVSQQGHLPQEYQINKYFFRLFPKIYFIGQQNCIFNYRNYFAWLIQGMLEATIITVISYFIMSQTAVNGKGYSTGFWLVGILVYSSVILMVTFKISTHTRFWSIILFLTIILLSLGLYVIYMWISNYAFSDHVEGTTYIAWTSAECYFLVLFCTCMVLFVDGLVVFMDFRRGSYASKMREIVYQEQINNRQFYDEVSATITSGLTASQQGQRDSDN